MTKNLYNRLFISRAVLSFFMIILLLLSCVLRVTVISVRDYQTKQKKQSEYRVDIINSRGTIYDCNMVPLTNNNKKTVAAVLPTPKAITSISKVADEYTINELKNGKPIVCELDEKIEAEGIKTATVYEQNTEDMSACHLIGYTDSSGHGVSGLELAYDELLYSDKKVSAVFSTDGKGRVLLGIEPEIENDITATTNAVVTTIDINVQNIVEKALLNIESGCAIVADVKNSKIKAMASAPKFDINDISSSLEANNSPMLNRALSCFSVGSVFKPCIAASIIESRYKDYNINCLGSLEIENRKFKCHKFDGHGQMNLCTALAQSCNCFFYDTANLLGAQSIYKKAAALSLGNKIKIAENLYTANGYFPKLEVLNTSSAIANLSIGQGTLLSSPVAVLGLYLAIAGDGSYYMPSVVEKTIKGGTAGNYDIGYKTRIMSNDTAKSLREYLKTVITDGTGVEAAPTLCLAAGKTATAQTGRYYKNGTEITISWFCGFFPADEPQYAVVVMSDSVPKVSTASIFAEITDGICRLINK